MNNNMNEIIKGILGSSITIGTKSIPVGHIKYRGHESTFVVWTIISETPSLCGDDKPLFTTTYVDVDVFSKGNYMDIMDAVKNLFKNNGWIWSEDSIEMYEDDTELYHRTITFSKERSI